MAERSITDLRNRWAGQDVYIVATGPSVDYIEPSFFDNKYALGVNEAWLRFPNVDFIVRKEALRSEMAYKSGIPLIISRWSCGAPSLPRNKLNGADDYFVFEHLPNTMKRIVWPQEPDQIVVSFSTITSAMHIAAYMGAANIILVGHDCGSLDGRRNMLGYPPRHTQHDKEFYDDFLANIEAQSVTVRKELKDRYGCNMYSLNPFLNFGLEAHEYERTG